MNIWVVRDPENDNFLTTRYKWSPHMYKARLFTHIAQADKSRAEMKRKIPSKKYIVQEYELIHRKDR